MKTSHDRYYKALEKHYNALKVAEDFIHSDNMAGMYYTGTTAAYPHPYPQVSCRDCSTVYSKGLGDKEYAANLGELYTAARMDGWYITAGEKMCLCGHCSEHMRQELNYYKKLRDEHSNS